MLAYQDSFEGGVTCDLLPLARRESTSDPCGFSCLPNLEERPWNDDPQFGGLVLCPLSHRECSFKAIVLAKYLSRELHYEPLESKSDKHAGNLLKRDGWEDYLCVMSPFALHLMPAGKSELVRQCPIPRKLKAEAPVLPLVKPGRGKISEIQRSYWPQAWLKCLGKSLCWWKQSWPLEWESLLDWPQTGQRPEWPKARLGS